MELEKNTKVYRFKINSNELYDEMLHFSKLHLYDNKTSLKENFNIWISKPNIESLIENEENILKRKNYDFEKNNMKQKIFRSIKYYHIRNLLKENNDKNTEIMNEKKKKVKVIVFSKEFLNQVKTYLTKNVVNENFKPSVYFNYFCETYPNIIEKEKNIIMENLNENYNEDDFENKLKKMFKNQYFSMFKIKS